MAVAQPPRQIPHSRLDRRAGVTSRSRMLPLYRSVIRRMPTLMAGAWMAMSRMPG
ncbi:hypothetical protein ACFQ3Z_02635 [Streptomyces nogalater]